MRSRLEYCDAREVEVTKLKERVDATMQEMVLSEKEKAELNQQKAEATGREKDKKSRVEYHARREVAL